MADLVAIETKDLLEELQRRFGTLVVVGSDPIEPDAPEAFHQIKGSTFEALGLMQWAQRAMRKNLVVRECDEGDE